MAALGFTECDIIGMVTMKLLLKLRLPTLGSCSIVFNYRVTCSLSIARTIYESLTVIMVEAILTS